MIHEQQAVDPISKERVIDRDEVKFTRIQKLVQPTHKPYNIGAHLTHKHTDPHDNTDKSFYPNPYALYPLLCIDQLSLPDPLTSPHCKSLSDRLDTRSLIALAQPTALQPSTDR